MRAKTINFQRGNIRKTLEVGQIHTIINWFKDYVHSSKGWHVFPDLSSEVYGHSVVHGTDWMPDNIHFSGDLNLEDSNIIEFPKGLVVTGNLVCRYKNINSIPDDMVVGRKLYCSPFLYKNIPKERISWDYYETSYIGYWEVKLLDPDEIEESKN